MWDALSVAMGDGDDRLDLRVSNAEREQVIEQLRGHVSDGRLTLDEFSDRMAEVYDARTQRELDYALRQLPRAAPPEPIRPPQVDVESWWDHNRGAVARFAMPNIVCISVWGMTTGGHAYFWPGWVLFGTGIGLVRRFLTGETKEQRRQRKLQELRDAFGKSDRDGDRRLGEKPGIPPQPPAGEAERVVSTVLFVDIVGSTERASAMGDARWRELLDDHERLIGEDLAKWQGRTVFTKGDEVVAAFDIPARAVQCAVAIRDDARTLGLEVRAGIHAGEVDRRGDDVSGVALHIGQRVSAVAAPGEVLVSSTVKELLAGSGIAFEDRGVQSLKGVPDEWRLYAVVAAAGR